MCKGGARELGPYGITVNVLAPGPVDTDIMGGRLTEERKESMSAGIPLGRVGQPVEAALALEGLLVQGVAVDVGHVVDHRVALYVIEGGLTVIPFVLRPITTASSPSTLTVPTSRLAWMPSSGRQRCTPTCARLDGQRVVVVGLVVGDADRHPRLARSQLPGVGVRDGHSGEDRRVGEAVLDHGPSLTDPDRVTWAIGCRDGRYAFLRPSPSSHRRHRALVR
jgi:hypothetical protein